ncbi:hypothetical protein ABZ687_29010 [Streptomyces ardesiacus]|uniref:hypothetical protein n=1 Tax=Streptomyces ardesiacus TaxID=285564 RepID=UPI0033E8E640
MASAKTTYRTVHPGTGEEVTFTKGGRPIRWITWGDFGKGEGFVHFGYSSQVPYAKAVRAPRSTNPYAERYEATPATVVEDDKPAGPTLAERFPVGSAAFFTPEGATKRDVVVVNSGPDQDGTVEVLSMKQGGAPLRAPLAALEELPELPPEPEGEITDWWTITDAQGAELTRVQAEDDPRARKAAERHPAVVAAIRRDKGFAVRRLRTSELSVPVGELPGAPRFSPAPAAEKPARTVPAAAQARRTITVRTEYVGRSIPSRLEAAGAPGQLQYSRKAGALRWVLPDGEELTPGQAAKRYLDA